MTDRERREAEKWNERNTLDALALLDAERAYARSLRWLVRWCLGEVGAFPPPEIGSSRYYWRKDLRKRLARHDARRKRGNERGGNK